MNNKSKFYIAMISGNVRTVLNYVKEKLILNKQNYHHRAESFLRS